MAFVYTLLGMLSPVHCIGLAGASENDGKVFESIRPALQNKTLHGNKAYKRPDEDDIQKQQGLIVLTPNKFPVFLSRRHGRAF